MANLVRFSFWRRPDILVTLLMIGIPVALLLVSGFLFILSEGWMPEFLLTSSFCVLVLFGFRFLWRRRASVHAGADGEVPEWLADPTWGPEEREVYEESCRRIRSRTRSLRNWDEGLLAMASEVAEDVAGLISDGRRDRLDVSLPELLLLLEQVAEEGREFLAKTVMFSFLHNVSINNLLWILRNRHVISRMAEGGDYLIKLTGIVMNPPVGAVRALESMISGSQSKYLSDQFQIELQRGILSYVAAKSVDLYSGRFKRQTSPETGSAAAEPLRILIVGQAGAGKSSLASAIAASAGQAIADEAATEVPHLPRIVLGGVQCILIEAPGLDGRPQGTGRFPSVRGAVFRVAGRGADGSGTEQSLLNCDMVIWVARADQPARKPDSDHLALFREVFGSRKWRLVPPLIVAATHVDRPPIINSWPNGSAISPAQELRIEEALKAVARTFGGTEPVPVRPIRPFWNADALIDAVKSAVPDACLAQSNRLRWMDDRRTGRRQVPKPAEKAAARGKGRLEVGPPIPEETGVEAAGRSGWMGRAAMRLPGRKDLKKRIGIGQWRRGKS